MQTDTGDFFSATRVNGFSFSCLASELALVRDAAPRWATKGNIFSNNTRDRSAGVRIHASKIFLAPAIS
jgi:hypothetical protein